MRNRVKLLACGVVAGALVLAACGKNDQPTPGPTGGTYSVAIESSRSFVPSNCYDIYCANVLSVLFTGLFAFQTQDDGTLVPEQTGLTNQVSTSDNGKTWKIELNSGWKFTNGEPITAKTFIDTWNFAAYAPNGQELGFVFGPSQLNVKGYSDVAPSDPKAEPKSKTMSGLKAVGKNTIQVSLVSPLGDALFKNFLAGPPVLPMPSVAFKDIKAYGKQPIGNGPYQLKKPWSATEVSLAKNSGYAGTPGNADDIEFRVYADNNTLWSDLQAGTLDVAPMLPQNALANAEQVLGDRFINDSASLLVNYFGFPKGEAFKDKGTRVAISKAIDWAEINSKLFYGTRQRALSFVSDAAPGGGTDMCGDKCVFDAAAAKKSLQQAGGLPGGKVRLMALASATQQTEKAICNQLQRNLGIECSIKVLPNYQAFFDAVANAEPGDLFQAGWAADNPTLASTIGPLFSRDGGGNDFGYDNPRFDKLMQEGNAAQSPGEQVAIWQRAEQVAMDDFWLAPTQFPNIVAGYSQNVSNVKVNSQAYVNLAQITVVK
ncbi:MAG: ABC transporter substrate-binding protein [Candidatus Nanopelagicales bacterium]|nr:ABC transporter substrate-binding protein [Candidatus Nanopelagicales bacterium]